jgi:hypothetical protein
MHETAYERNTFNDVVFEELLLIFRFSRSGRKHFPGVLFVLLMLSALFTSLESAFVVQWRGNSGPGARVSFTYLPYASAVYIFL